MGLVKIDESILTAIAGAIRSKLGVATTYKPNQMASAIGTIEEVNSSKNGQVVVNGHLANQTSKSITENGTHDTTTNNSVTVNVEHSFVAEDEGKVVSNGALVSQTSTTKNANGTYDTTLNNEVVINVPNSYSAGDEGKVVSNGALVAQSSQTITQDGTYDTTLKNEVVVSVGGGGSTLVPKSITQNGTYNPADDNADGYSSVTVNVSGGSQKLQRFDWDFRESLVDSVSGITATLAGGATQTSDGISLGSASARITIPAWVKMLCSSYTPLTIELDLGNMSRGSASNHGRLLMTADNTGLIYRNTGAWSLYNGSWATASDITDFDFFANSILKVVVDEDNYWHIYKDNVLVYEPNRALSLGDNNSYFIGSNDYSAFNAVIKGLRISNSL